MDFSIALSHRSKAKREKNETAMRDAIALLNSLGVRFSQPDPYMLQFHGYTYWPGKQRLYREDDEHSSTKQGLQEIATLIRSFKLHSPMLR